MIPANFVQKTFHRWFFKTLVEQGKNLPGFIKIIRKKVALDVHYVQRP